MRLLRIHLRNFRGVHDRAITLAESGVTVLQGENEVGKTTTIRALDLLVDTPDSSRRAEVRAAAPAGVDAGPEVEAEIVAGPYRFVYRKRWIRRPLTELTVHAPVREQLTGPDAHARVTAMLDETMDRDLWRALRIEQQGAVGQAELGGLDALTRALDRAAGTDPEVTAQSADRPGGEGTDAGLVDRAEQEARRYRTATGKATGDLRAAEDRLTAAVAEHERCRTATDAVEHDVAARDRLDAELDALRRRRRAHRARVAELEDRWAALQSRLREVDAARVRADAAHDRAAAARQRAAERAAAADALAAADADLAHAEARVDEQARTHAATRAERDAGHDEHRAAHDAAARARRASRAADDALALARDHAELTDLGTTLRRVADAEAGLHAADRALAGIAVDQDVVDALDERSREVVRAEAARDAGSAAVEVVVPADAPALDVVLDGAAVRMAPGETRRLPAHEAVSVSVPERLEVRVRPGRDGHGLAEAARRAADALAAACADAGVADPAAARAALRRADDARHRRDEHRATLDRELAGRDVAEVRAAHERLRTRVEAADAATPGAGTADTGNTGNTGNTGGTGDVHALREAADAAREAADEADRTVDRADRRRRLADEAVAAADTAAALLGQRAADARHARDGLAADLAAARVDAPDADLVAAEAASRAHARDADHAHEALAAAVAADDPDTVEVQVVNARGVDDRLATESADLDRERAETTGRLQSAGQQGWHDQLTAAADELEAARREHDATARRARAATRLHHTLLRHRDAVRRAYVAPFRTQVERLARIVFGPTLSLEVDAALRITHRTLQGVTVPFDELSSGAKEQLALCARLACAALVDPADGVPVVIDDALGHSDPERLARLGAVFTATTTGERHGAAQVLVLTCTPERYRGVGAATVVPLTPSRAPAVREREPSAALRVAGDVGEDPPGLDLPRTG